MTRMTRRWREWWTTWLNRLAMGSALTLTMAVPAVAFADTATDPQAAPDKYECAKACGEPQEPQAPGTSREDVRQATDQDHAQSSYQLGSGQPEQATPEHPYTQAHYQLGAGHQD